MVRAGRHISEEAIRRTALVEGVVAPTTQEAHPLKTCNMCVCVSTYIYIYIYIYICLCVCLCVYVKVPQQHRKSMLWKKWQHVYAYMHVYVRLYVQEQLPLLCVLVCMCVYVCAFACACIPYIHKENTSLHRSCDFDYTENAHTSKNTAQLECRTDVTRRKHTISSIQKKGKNAKKAQANRKQTHTPYKYIHIDVCVCIYIYTYIYMHYLSA
jgi:hypothetical protein